MADIGEGRLSLSKTPPPHSVTALRYALLYARGGRNMKRTTSALRPLRQNKKQAPVRGLPFCLLLPRKNFVLLAALCRWKLFLLAALCCGNDFILAAAAHCRGKGFSQPAAQNASS
ncbi:MAG TPA: hypothetical protein H9851_04250 [Candidatus Borkfalkia faecavium]|uniref:Uncharacterized protein n=1 Tax=Candidatus Borkfalkia faecavium TaxID=2838508 RepID=A0A9D1W1B6_9FIRM|nr:hypothetical protein [Candidatus Borkfalkia faecavium]